MATDITEDKISIELDEFLQYVSTRCKGKKMPLEEALQNFRLYQKQRDQLREEIRPALEASLRGESVPFDAEDVIQRGEERLAEKGITD